MTKIRRSPYVFFYLEDGLLLDIGALLGGAAQPRTRRADVVALSILTGVRHRLHPEEFDFLRALPSQTWVDDRGLDAASVRELGRKGVLVSDADESELRRLRDRDEALSGTEWNLYAALYHYMTQWSGVDIRTAGEEVVTEQEKADAASAFVERYGQPPPPFPATRSNQIVPLPATERAGGLYRALAARRTTRAFDRGTPMTVAQLDAVLRYVFGCHGYARLTTGTVCIKRTSPSGGGLHPIDAYPIVTNVDGIEPGIYQYLARDHALARLSGFDADDGRRISTSLMCGQSYFGDAHVSFVLTARFARNHWKYRRHHKAYAAMLMDAAHLSQTLHLVCADLGLGAFVTVAINARDIEACLELDGVGEGVIAMTGCGPRAAGESPLELQVSPAPLS